MKFLHQISRLAIVGPGVVLAIDSGEPELVHMRHGPVAGAGGLPDTSGKID